MIRALFVVLSLMAGCATDHERALAYVEPGFKPLPKVYLFMADPDGACRVIGTPRRDDERTLACANFDGRVWAGKCVVILPFNPPAWMVEHENDHCERGRWHD